MKFYSIIIFTFILFGCQSDVSVNINEPSSETKETPTEDVSCKVNLSLLSTLSNSTGSNGQASFILGNFGFASTDGGTEVLQIVDFSDEDNVINRGEYDPSGNSFLDLYAEDNVLYGSSINGELHSIDISDPDNPVNLDVLSIPDQNWGMVAKGDYLYIGNYGSGLNIVDKSNPSNLINVNSVAGYGLMHMQIENNTLYGTTGRRIVIMDITNPTSPTLIGDLDLGASWMAYEIYKAGNYIYAIAKPQELLQTIDISDPTNPSLVYTSTAVGDGNDFRSITGTNNKIFIGTGSSESGFIRAYDIKENPIEPLLEDTVAASNRVYEISLKDQYIFTSNRGGRAELFKYTCD